VQVIYEGEVVPFSSQIVGPARVVAFGLHDGVLYRGEQEDSINGQGEVEIELTARQYRLAWFLAAGQLVLPKMEHSLFFSCLDV
jgi:hypothetical protein